MLFYNIHIKHVHTTFYLLIMTEEIPMHENAKNKILKIQRMWCDQEKWDLCRAYQSFRFEVYFVKQSENFVLLKLALKSDSWFWRHLQIVHLKNKIQKELHTIL